MTKKQPEIRLFFLIPFLIDPFHYKRGFCTVPQGETLCTRFRLEERRYVKKEEVIKLTAFFTTETTVRILLVVTLALSLWLIQDFLRKTPTQTYQHGF